MSASRVAPAGSSTNLPWVTRQVSTYRSRAAGSSGTTSSSRRRCSPAGRSAAARAGAGRRGWRGAGWRPRGRCRGAGRSASALRWSPVLATVRWYSGPNCSCSRPVRRRCPSTTASSTITTTTTRIAITMPPFMAAPFLGPEEPTLGERLAGAPTRRRPLQTPEGSCRQPAEGAGCACLPRLPCPRLGPGCVWLRPELAVDPDVGPLVVEGDQVGDLGALRDRERVAPGDVLLDRGADPGRPVAGRALVGALGLAVGRRQQVHADVGLGKVVAGGQA